jgi:hypothetical protein
MAKGKWAQGIPPRDFKWVIKDKFAICEKLGGFGEQHRAVRRQEEVIWVRERRFRYVISLQPGDDLSGYDELGVRWKHWPLPLVGELDASLDAIYTELQKLIRSDSPILIHMEEVSDRLAGFIGGYLVFTGMVPEISEAIQLTERLMERASGPAGRQMITIAARIVEENAAATEDAGAESAS